MFAVLYEISTMAGYIGTPATAQILECGHGPTYQSRMPVRLLRQFFSVLLMAAYVSATILSVVPSANAAPPAMADGMMMTMDQTGDAMPMPCSKGMKSSCIGDMGCIFMVSLPAAHSGVVTTIAWSGITYAVADDYLREHSIKPALGPPRSRT